MMPIKQTDCAAVLIFVTLCFMLVHVADSQQAVAPHGTADNANIQQLISAGKFLEAERLLQEHRSDTDSPAMTKEAIDLEILRRIRLDFGLTENEVLAQIQASIPDVTSEDLQVWREAGDLQCRLIDGEIRYFNRSVSNLFRFNKDAQQRHQDAKSNDKKFDLNAHLEMLVHLADRKTAAEIHPVRHQIRYELQVKAGHPRWQPRAKVRVWLPFPQEYRQQKSVKLISSKPVGARVADNNVAQRTIYFEHTVNDDEQPQPFVAEFEFVTSAYYPKLDPERVEPYDTDSHLYQEFTAQRAPHIVFTPEVRSLAAEIVGSETNPLNKTLKIFRWVSQNVPWCAEIEYSTIPNLSAKGLAARRGDCGVQGMTFITLCRAAGVPARWQSGWQTQPDDWNMHDWSEFYVEPWGWLPADASYGVRDHVDTRVRDFFCGHLDPYRLIVNQDYGRELQPPKISFRSEPNDFQRGEVEIDGHNLYFNEWDWKFRVRTTPISESD